MKTIQLINLVLILFLLQFTACKKEDGTTMDTYAQQDLGDENAENNISEKIYSKLEQFYLNTNDVKKVKVTYPDGTTNNLYEVEGDLLFSEDQIMELSLGTTKQYRTNNLVTQGMNINVLGWTGSGLALNSNARTALANAVNNFGNLGITFSLSFGTNHQAADIVVYDNSAYNSSRGGRAGFPHNGNPHKWIQIYGLGTNEQENEHVMTHEIGHAVGLRHTDWDTRQSCGGFGESAGWQGAIHIPGTPTGFDATSIMKACYNPNNITGELNANDIIALEFLYPQ